MATAIITTKYLKQSQYSNLFKVCEINVDNPLLEKFVKQWEDAKMIYLKEKYMNIAKTPIEVGKYYKMKLRFDTFTKDGEEITYINGIRYKQVEYEEKKYDSEGSDF